MLKLSKAVYASSGMLLAALLALASCAESDAPAGRHGSQQSSNAGIEVPPLPEGNTLPQSFAELNEAVDSAESALSAANGVLEAEPEGSNRQLVEDRITRWIEHLRQVYRHVEDVAKLEEAEKKELLDRIGDLGGTPPERIPNPPPVPSELR